MEQRNWRKNAGRAAIEFLPPIETGLDKRPFMGRLEDTIETASDHLIAEFSGRPYARPSLVLRSQGEDRHREPASASSRERFTRPTGRLPFALQPLGGQTDFSSVSWSRMSRLMMT